MTTPNKNPLVTAISLLVIIGLGIIGFVALSYFIIILAIAGLIAFIISFVRAQWARRFGTTSSQNNTQPNTGRVIEHEDD